MAHAFMTLRNIFGENLLATRTFGSFLFFISSLQTSTCVCPASLSARIQVAAFPGFSAVTARITVEKERTRETAVSLMSRTFMKLQHLCGANS